jgi:hypothetical protein
MGDALKKAVLAYVKNGDESDKQAVVRLNQWTTLTSPRTVYRGQGEDSAEKDPSKMSLFSVSTDRTVAVDEFGGDKGCVWTITLLPGVQVIDVNAAVGNHGKEFEAELLVKGGGSMKFSVSRDPACKIAATYGPPAPSLKEVTLDTLKQRAEEIGDDLSETVEDFKMYLNPGEVFKGGRRRRKTKSKKVKGRTRKHRK